MLQFFKNQTSAVKIMITVLSTIAALSTIVGGIIKFSDRFVLKEQMEQTIVDIKIDNLENVVELYELHRSDDGEWPSQACKIQYKDVKQDLENLRHQN